ncbi:ATP synthase F1 subcomplex epsilon subunit [Gemmobacter megaterium]|uniref:ATP synthase epsilon chain n=1 Tax=Gemmobacter megaterium TaxID=1086013 RepID=A0A1N7KXF4_9RHOB|nr:F0F1 ATP synthase subunit epsilon [Gemmobacter megaterium]GGE04379.1 ATP synthase epsilon chain 1 [Gemmobacter megaterium]SIS66299.1 ATP synthase F1 subcomplex epsilon subunit [Gemmobacter megaterium]
MANTVQFDLVSPERKLSSVAATEVQIPGAEGDLTAMQGHSPLITTLRPGVLKAVSAAGTQAYAVTGGFAEITAGSVSVLAEQAIPVAEATAAVLDALISDARQRAETATDKAAADKFAADMVALKAAVGA